VVEVKHYTEHKVGLAVVDRIFGVRAREGVDRSLLVTTSGVTATARRTYGAHSTSMAFVDGQALDGLLASRRSDWRCSASGLWSLPGGR